MHQVPIWVIRRVAGRRRHPLLLFFDDRRATLGSYRWWDRHCAPEF